ncbi:cold shock domain-containing protein 3 [Forsythia ovata]|uniref:Cold shock domain-containing protein 3 n=1 Tax=Forsythia ovata TaxID=205694 RepID=A0ABD1WSJ0_9LAMI
MAEEKVARSKGVVSKFNDQKGYGFIKPDEGGDDLFVHQTAIKSDGYRTLREGQAVEFTIILEGDKTKAIDVTIADGGSGDYSSRRGSSNNSRGGYGFSDRRNNGNGYGYRTLKVAAYVAWLVEVFIWLDKNRCSSCTFLFAAEKTIAFLS